MSSHERPQSLDHTEAEEMRLPETVPELKDKLEEAYKSALGLGVPIVLETPDATVVITPRKIDRG